MIKEPWEITCIRESCRRLAQVVDLLKQRVAVGMTSGELDAIAEQAIGDQGGRPSFKGYQVGDVVFPATICVSINHEVVHGIPGDHRVFADGDVISVDVGLVYGGYHSDCAFTVQVGQPTDAASALIAATKAALHKGIGQVRPGNRIGDVGHAVESSVRPLGYGVIQDYVGHGIGRALHEPPSVPNYGKPGRGLLLKPGMCLAIEPMITLGTHEVKLEPDGWTVVTADHNLAAHFEHTVLVTPRGPEVLTMLRGSTPAA